MSEAEAITTTTPTSAAPLAVEPTATDPTPAPEEGAKPEASEPAKPEEPSRIERAQAAAAAASKRWRQRQAAREEVQQAQAAIAARDAEIERLRLTASALDAAKSDPLAWLEKQGVPPEKLVRSAIQKGTPEGEIASLKQELAEMRAARESEREEAKKQAQRATAMHRYSSSRDEFLTLVADEEKYPALAAHAAARGQSLFREACEVADEVMRRTNGRRNPGAKEVAKYLEGLYGGIKPGQKREAQAKSLGSNPNETDTASGRQEKSQTGKPRTLTNDASAQKGALSKDLYDMSEDEARAALADQIRRMRGE
jgi:hypothetical protein